MLMAGLLALSAPAAPFSHKTHLAKKLECVMCHSGAAGSTSAKDNLIPATAVCAGCHQDERASFQPKQPRSNVVNKFNHQLHVKLGPAIAATVVQAIDAKTYLSDPGNLRTQLEGTKHPCTGCHRGLALADATGAEHFPHMADCLVCHNKIDAPFSCEKCHDQKPEELKPASHIAGFLDKHSNKAVEKTSCAVCHGRRFTCLGCH